MRFCLQLNNNGSSIPSVMLVMMVIGLSTFAVLSKGAQQRKSTSQLNSLAVISKMKQKLVGIVQTPSAWQIIQSRNPNAFSGIPNANGVLPLLDIYSPEMQTPLLATTAQNIGFDWQGNVCSGYNHEGNDQCPLRYEIRLKSRSFQNNNWIETLRFELKYSPANSSALVNTSSPEFSFDLVRNFNDQSVETACISMNGSYDNQSNSCSFKVTHAVSGCQGGQTYRGPASNSNQSNCELRVVREAACQSSQVIKGFDANGSPICGSPL